jgi:hypothetical protein
MLIGAIFISIVLVFQRVLNAAWECFNSMIVMTIAALADAASKPEIVKILKFNMSTYSCYIGDLVRYQLQYQSKLHLCGIEPTLVAPGSVKTMLIHEESNPLSWYHLALTFDPASGRAHNQIAIIALDNHSVVRQSPWNLQYAIYHYLRAASALKPFAGATENIAQLAESMKRVQRIIDTVHADPDAWTAMRNMLLHTPSAPFLYPKFRTGTAVHALFSELSEVERERAALWLDHSSTLAALRAVSVLYILFAKHDVDKLNDLMPALVSDWAQPSCVSNVHWLQSNGIVIACSLIVLLRQLLAEVHDSGFSASGVSNAAGVVAKQLATHALHLLLALLTLSAHQICVLLRSPQDAKSDPNICSTWKVYLSTVSVMLSLITSHEPMRAFVQQIHVAGKDDDWTMFCRVLKMAAQQIDSHRSSLVAFRCAHVTATVHVDEEYDEETGEVITFRGTSSQTKTVDQTETCWVERQFWRRLELEALFDGTSPDLASTETSIELILSLSATWTGGRQKAAEAVTSSEPLNAPAPAFKQRSLQMVILDAANICMRFGSGDTFATSGLRKVFDWFESRGVRCMACVPDHTLGTVAPSLFVRSHRTGIQRLSVPALPDDPAYLRSLEQQGKLFSTPSQDYDDSYILALARRNDAFVVSNDKFRDQFERMSNSERSELENWLPNHVIGFTFVGLQKDFLPNPDKVRLLLEERS